MSGPVSGQALPGPLPAGERILWQGKPGWRGLARDVLHLRGLALYFAVLLVWFCGSEALRGVAARDVALDTGRAALVAAVPLALGLVYAWATARATTYTITNRRVTIKLGLALPMTANLPFAQIDGAGLRGRSDGSGDIALQMAAGKAAQQLSWLLLWPHTRPWHFARPQPQLRSVEDAARVGQILSLALSTSIDTARAVPVILAQTPKAVESASRRNGAAVTA